MSCRTVVAFLKRLRLCDQFAQGLLLRLSGTTRGWGWAHVSSGKVGNMPVDESVGRRHRFTYFCSRHLPWAWLGAWVLVRRALPGLPPACSVVAQKAWVCRRQHRIQSAFCRCRFGTFAWAVGGGRPGVLAGRFWAQWDMAQRACGLELLRIDCLR